MYQTFDPHSSLDPRASARPPFSKDWQAELWQRRCQRFVVTLFRHKKPLTCGIVTNVQSLQNKRVLSIDLAAIMAGSGIRGQFEDKFKALLRDIEDEVRSITTFSFNHFHNEG